MQNRRYQCAAVCLARRYYKNLLCSSFGTPGQLIWRRWASRADVLPVDSHATSAAFHPSYREPLVIR